MKETMFAFCCCPCFYKTTIQRHKENTILWNKKYNDDEEIKAKKILFIILRYYLKKLIKTQYIFWSIKKGNVIVYMDQRIKICRKF